MFSFDQQRRFARHILLEPVGEVGQKKLLSARVAMVGCGGLGSAALPYLAAAGIGHLTLIDPDRVELSNLQRQVLYEEGDIGRLKAEAAEDRLSEMAAACRVTLHALRLDAANAHTLLAGHDLVLDGCDNFTTRYAVADACAALGIPLVSAALQGFRFQLATFRPGGPCYRCFVPEEPEDARTCTESGVLGPLAGVAGAWQAAEAIRELLGLPGSLAGKLFRADWLTNRFATSTLHKDPACKSCGVMNK